MKKLGKTEGLGWISTWLAYGIYGIASKIFKLDGHINFWEKFIPKSEPTYILFNNKYISPQALRSLMKAFNVSLWN